MTLQPGAGTASPPLPSSLTSYQIRIAQARHDLCLRYDALVAAYEARGEKLSLNRAARLLGKNAGRLHAHLDLWLPRRDFTDLIPPANAGRPARWKEFALRADVRAKLQEFYLLSCGASSDGMTKGRRSGSAASTLAVFGRDPLCQAEPELAEELLAGTQPVALLRVIREINDLHEQKLRGAKHSSLNAQLIMRRTLVEILADGTAQPIAPGDWWVFDDMSDNLPHWWTGPEGLPFVGRQGLYAFDVRRRWVGVEKLGTVRDAYTAAIILRFVRKLMLACGKPRRGVVFERSVWQARTIKGCRITPSGGLEDVKLERGAMSEHEKSELQRGLSALGIIVHYTHTPRGKEIEGAFHHLQRLKPMIAAQWAARNGHTQPVNIGRHAGEFEHGAKQLRRVRNRSHHPADLGFLHMEQSLDIDLETMRFIDRDQGDYPALAPLRAEDHAVFLPEKRDLQIRDGHVTATVDGMPLDFCAPELFASLGSGYRLTIAFDPSDPLLGAAIYNAETSSANWPGWKQGEFIGHAGFLPMVARFDHREGGHADVAGDLRRRFNKHVRTAFAAVVGLRHARVSEARDGRGEVATTAGHAAGAPNPGGAPAAPRQVDGRAAALALPPTRDSVAELFGG
jgi:hypothetical protein